MFIIIRGVIASSNFFRKVQLLLIYNQAIRYVSFEIQMFINLLEGPISIIEKVNYFTMNGKIINILSRRLFYQLCTLKFKLREQGLPF